MKRDNKRANNLLEQYKKLTDEQQDEFLNLKNEYETHKFFTDLDMEEPDYSNYAGFLKGARKDG